MRSGSGRVLSRDWVYVDLTQLVTFLQNHDAGPDMTRPAKYEATPDRPTAGFRFEACERTGPRKRPAASAPCNDSRSARFR